MPDVHVVPSGEQWACEIDGNKRSTHATQQEAIETGPSLGGGPEQRARSPRPGRPDPREGQPRERPSRYPRVAQQGSVRRGAGVAILEPPPADRHGE